MPSSSGPVACIDLDALAHNFSEVRRLVGDRVEVLAMVKSDAYGHGAAAVVECLVRQGCRRFGVATLEEADEVRRRAPTAECVVFGGILPADAQQAVALGVSIAAGDREVCESLALAASARGGRVGVHLKIDTGMHRLGIEPDLAPEFISWLQGLPGIEAVGVCSHFACAESVTGEMTYGQVEALTQVAKALKDRVAGLKFHVANSAAILSRPQAHLDMVRPGIMLYGLLPDAALAGKAELRRVMRLQAPVMRIAEVGKGQGISYGHTFRTTRASRIATLRCGYADGYPRALSNVGTVRIGGKQAPVVGRVCMDHTMIDVSEIEGIGLGDLAEMWGPDNPTEEQAAAAGTISYELVARVGKRVPRIAQGDVLASPGAEGS